MKRHLVIGLFVCLGCMTIAGQEQDTIKSVDRMLALKEVVIKGGLPNT